MLFNLKYNNDVLINIEGNFILFYIILFYFIYVINLLIYLF